MRVRTKRFDETIVVRCPASLPRAIDRASARLLMSPSEYIRRCVVDRLHSEGIDPAQLAEAV